MSFVKTIIADNQFLTREGLISFLRTKNTYEVIAVVESKKQLSQYLKPEEEYILILDYAASDFDNVLEVADLLSKYPRLGILVLVNEINKQEIINLKDVGINVFVLKTIDHAELGHALEHVRKIKKYFSEEILDVLLDKNTLKPLVVHKTINNTGLTHTEVEIVKLIADGLTTKEIAVKKFVSFHTVNTHRKNIFRKLNINTVSELIVLAIKAGLVDGIEYNI